MHLEYEINRDEYFQASRAVAATAAWAKPARFFRAAPYAACAAGFVLLVQHNEMANWLAPLLLVLAGLTWAIQPYSFSHSSVERAWRESKHANRPVVLEASEDGLEMRAGAWRSQIGWETFDHFTETRDLFLLFVTPSSIHTMIPKRSFPPGPQLDEFRALLGRKVRNSSKITPAGIGGRQGFEVITDRRSPPPEAS